MKIFLFSTLITLLSSALFGQYYYTPNTYYVIPPNNGCDGVWVVNDSILSTGFCSPPYMLTITPTGCASYSHNIGDSLFLNLCSIPCSYSMTSFSSSTPCFNCSVSTSTESVSSSCIAADSVIAKYKEDADRLALRRVNSSNSTYIDSVNISEQLSDTILKAIIAVYNATTLPARDTVIEMFNIHSFPVPQVKKVLVSADPGLAWMQQLQNNIIPTGNSSVDSLMEKYYLNMYSYHTWSNLFSYHSVELLSDSNFNISMLAHRFEAISGVQFASPVNAIGDGNNITDSVYSNFVELVFSLGWGDCPSGCTERRYWKFHIFPDCSVSYLGSYGNLLNISEILEVENTKFKIYPNPSSGAITINSDNIIKAINIYNVLGEEVYKSIMSNVDYEKGKGIEINLNTKPKGIYFVSINFGDKALTKKVVIN